MLKDINLLDLTQTYTYADYLTWQFDEMVELIRGQVFRMSPAPGSSHQWISAELHYQIMNHLRGKKCKAFAAPFDVRLPLPNKLQSDNKIDTVVQPDISIICDLKKIDEKGCQGAPDWIIEILSKGTASKDLTEKYQIYENAGVKEYWIVDPMNKSLMIYSLNEEGKYLALGPFNTLHSVQPVLFPDLTIDLNTIFPTADYVEEEWDDNYIRL